MFKLTPLPVFEDHTYSFADLSVKPAPIGELVSLSARHGQEQSFQKLFKKLHKNNLPAPTKLVKTNHGYIGWLGPDQYLAEIENADENIDKKLAIDFKGSASVTLQSDAWVGLDISGRQVLELLERLIALDTSEKAFPAGSMTRTQMHHLGVFVLRYPDATNSYRLLSARSSAQYFLHAVTQTAENICGDPL